ncbi:hypothetical protein SAMN04489835_4689 [Mycolicibacterium rutilum]|uniref:Uncharacterized protein n=1 Tax=Mycolicibacterium rutilum TaxID=370526 RepID=A0A1H6LBR4_MYCRU|nr:hypothetical protein [Mycolicibacterium rutilum]SEH83444.1 hypothetical protein SAMN04489835_4689 [Mycolicibacterium rutilum]
MPDEPPEMLAYETESSAELKEMAGDKVAGGAAGAAVLGTGSGAAGYLDDGSPPYFPGGEVEALGQGAEGSLGVGGTVNPRSDDEE